MTLRSTRGFDQGIGCVRLGSGSEVLEYLEAIGSIVYDRSTIMTDSTTLPIHYHAVKRLPD